MRWILAVAAAAFGLAAYAQDVGQIKNAKGAVHVEREGKRIPAKAGMPVRSSDTLVTGADGAVGVTMRDDTRLSLGPNSEVRVDRYVYAPGEGGLGMWRAIANSRRRGDR